MSYSVSSPPPIHAILTLIVHDEAIQFGGGTCGKAATVLLEVKKAGRKYLLAQTYLCIPVEPGVDLEFVRTEGGLDIAASGFKPSLLTRLLFQDESASTQAPEVGQHFSQALRNIFGITGGHAIIAGTPATRQALDSTDTAASPIFESELAGVVRMKIDVKFVQDLP